MNLVGQFHWTGNHIDISDLAKLVKESCSACSTKTQKGETILSESQIEQWNNEIVGDWVHEESSEKTSYGNTPGGKSPSEKNAIRSIRLYQLFMSFSPNGEATGKHYVHKLIVNNGEKTIKKADSALFRGLWRLAHDTLFVDGQDSIVWPGSLILGKTPTYQKRFIIQKIEGEVERNKSLTKNWTNARWSNSFCSFAWNVLGEMLPLLLKKKKILCLKDYI